MFDPVLEHLIWSWPSAKARPNGCSSGWFAQASLPAKTTFANYLRKTLNDQRAPVTSYFIGKNLPNLSGTTITVV